MTNILLTGIPRVGKTDLVEQTRGLSREFYETRVAGFSLGEIVAEEAEHRGYASRDRIVNISPHLQELLRDCAVYKAESMLLRGIIDKKNDHNIIDTPLTLMLGSIRSTTFNADQLRDLDRAVGGISFVVNLIDAEEDMAAKYANAGKHMSKEQMLDLIANEVQQSQALPISYTTIDGVTTVVRNLVIPRQNSDETLVKLLNHKQKDFPPPIVYVGFPITHVAKNAEIEKAIDDFISEFQEYCVAIVPMKIADLNARTKEQVEHVVNRDLNWFIKGSGIMVAYFPTDVPSTGVPAEMTRTLEIGKPVVLIHPNYEKGGEVFGVRPTLGFRDKKEFFEAVMTSKDSRYDNTDMALLRRFLDDYQDVPRYAHLRKFAVALDLVDDQGRHLLARKVKKKIEEKEDPFGGFWTLVGGKVEKDKDPTIKDAVVREALEEVGLTVYKSSEGYRIHPTQYGSAKYVRIFRSSNLGKEENKREFDGQVRANNIVRYPEVEDPKWLTVDEILAMKEPILKATRDYFRDVKEGKVKL